ncbi:MAG: 30S ribosomal protein S20 [Desulfobacca sp.]|uniref:30S ribosomal protein S20 n=1 Tax=Desulfobacca sp. TaxID=2067990 RepID=UPI00404970ED
MAKHPSVMKRDRQSKVRRVRNMSRKTRVKKLVKEVRLAVVQNQPEQAQAALQQAVPIIQRVAAKGTLHWKTAARKISRLTRRVNTLLAQS